MQDWNMVVTVSEGGFVKGIKFLEPYGEVTRTEYFNVLVMKVDNIRTLLEAIREAMALGREEPFFLSRAVPATRKFNFQSPEEFRERGREIAAKWGPELAGKGFYTRVHRRGFKGRLSSPEAERWLNDAILEAAEKAGNPSHITFSDPDGVVVVETVGTQAGLSLWMREALNRYPFLRVD